jgi:hypothetical protein
MEILNAKFTSTCAETGVKIKKGERMVYDRGNKKPYAIGSNTAIAFIAKSAAPEQNSDGAIVQANEEAYFDNFCWQNNI